MRCAHNPPPCRIVQGPWTMVHGPWTDNDDNDDAKNDNNSNWQKLPFPWKNIISPFIFAWFLSILGAWEPVLEAWVTFWAQGSDFCDFWDLAPAKNYFHLGPKMTRNRLKIDPKLNKFFDHFFDRLWSALGTDLVGFWEAKWSQNWSKIDPKSDHEENSKIIKIHWFLYTFEASKAPEINQKSLLRRC